MADLSTLLEKEASAEIETVLSEAQKRASEIVAKAESEAQALLAARQRSVATQHEATLVRARSAAQLEASSLRLNAQHDGVQSVFSAAKQQIDEIKDDPAVYTPIFRNLLNQVLAGAGQQTLEAIEVAPSDVELAKQSLESAGVNLPVEAVDDVSAGVRVRTSNRSRIESTLYSRLEALSGELASEVSAALFGAKAG